MRSNNNCVWIFALVCFLGNFSAEAQRRSGPTESETPRASRGRTRFTLDQSLVEDQRQEAEPRRPAPRRKPQSSVPQPPVRSNYEVQEEFEDTPVENYKKFGKPRVFTESKYEAPNAPPTNLFQPSTTESLDDVIKSIGVDLLDSTTTPLPSPLSSTLPTVELTSEASLSSTEASKINNEVSTARSNRRNNLRTKKVEDTTAGRTRIRTRPSARTEEASTSSAPVRSFRRRPSAASSAETKVQETPEVRPRSRPNVDTRGRLNRQESIRNENIEPRSRANQQEIVKNVEAPKNRENGITGSLEHGSRFSHRARGETVEYRSKQQDAKTTPEPRTSRTTEESTAKPPQTTPLSRFRTRGSPTQGPSVLSTAEAGDLPTRSRTGRKIGPTKEPLRETPKPRTITRRRPQQETTTAAARTRSRSRAPPVIDEQKLEVLPLFEDEPKIVRPNKFRRPNSAEEVPSATENHARRAKFEPRVKESVVISEVTEVTSRKTVPKRKYVPKSKPHSAEVIDEGENYPEHFKALLKKKYNESRSSQHRTEKVVTSARSTAPPPKSLLQQETENELEPPKPSSKRYTTTTTLRPTRKRFSPHPRTTGSTTTTEKPTKTRPTPEHKFHAKFQPKPHETTSHKPLHFSPKPPRGLYSSRKIKESPVAKNEVDNKLGSTPKKANRFSSRYRYNTNTRTSTNAPAYLPTIPAVVPNPVTKDKDLGVEVITFDDPVVTIPSANLVNGDYTTAKPLVSESQVRTSEKPISIIERIIHSISAISTEEPISSTSTPATTTKPSAILKLASSKKPTTLNTLTSIPVTTEKPTTIIERILSSLTAINSTNEQVGNSETFFSPSSTTPMSKVVRSAPLPAQFSTSTLSPVNVINEISEEQTLQKRTIGKLLDLLNSLITTPQTPEVLVTPKSTILYTSAPVPFSASSSLASTSTTALPLSAPSSLASTTTDAVPPTTTSIPFSTSTSSSSVLPTTIDSTTLQTITPSDLPNDISTTLKLDSLSTIIDSTTTPVTVQSDTETVFTVPPTAPSLHRFEVSPGSVSIFSANDISNFVTPDDFLSTVTIAGKTNFPETVATTVESTTNDPTTTILPTVANPTTTKDVSSNVIDTTGSTVDKANQTVSSTTTPSSANTTSPNRSGRLLNVVQDSVSNSLDNNSTQDPDYYIFAVLNNNTILRKRPSKYPKDAPFLIVGLYPNNTIVRKFPNGTVVPMEPVIRVSGFDTRENPPPLPEITSNQVTPDQGRRPDNQTVEQNTIPTVDTANPLSISSTSSTSSSTSTTTVPSTTVTLPALTEILNGKTVQAFNSIINISDLRKSSSTTAASTTTQVMTTIPPATLSNRILGDFMKISTIIPTETTERQEISNTIAPSTTLPNTTPKITTALPLTQPSTTSLPTTTLFPSFITTFLSTLQPRIFPTTPFIVTPEQTTIVPTVTTSTTTPAATTTKATTTAATTTTTPATTTTTSTTTATTTKTTAATTPSTTIKYTTTPTSTSLFPLFFRSLAGDLIGSGSTARPVTTAAPQTTSTTTTTTTTTPKPTTTTKQSVPTLNTKKPLTEQQKKDLETIAQLEKEQAQILKQLSFLANLNLGNNKPSGTTDKNSLANRIIATAVERDKSKSIPRESKKISDQPALNYEDLVKQISGTPSTLTTQFGSNDDALIATLLKEQGIGPTTPESLSDVYAKTTTTTRRPKTTTPAPPGPLMRSLNWLLNALSPPTTRRPKPKPKPQPKPKDEETLSYQPTHITPVVTAAPPKQNVADSLTQEDIQKLIRQLEGVQKDPSKAKSLDLSSFKSLQTLIHADEGEAKSRVIKATTAVPLLSISNSIVEEETTTTSKPRVTLPPVKLRPVPGVEDGETRIRGQLINAAVNVTRAISSFLGSAIQGAATRLTTFVRGSSSNSSGYV